MSEDTAIKDAIKANATGPKAASDDSTTVQQHSLPDQIAADKYTKSNDAVSKNPRRGLRFNRITPGNDW